jgi:hypothetical protein
MPKSKSVSTEAPKKARKPVAAAAAKPTYDDIALRAYHIYLERGATPGDPMPGDPMEDWLQAERELSAAPKTPRRKTKIVSIAA